MKYIPKYNLILEEEKLINQTSRILNYPKNKIKTIYLSEWQNGLIDFTIEVLSRISYEEFYNWVTTIDKKYEIDNYLSYIYPFRPRIFKH